MTQAGTVVRQDQPSTAAGTTPAPAPEPEKPILVSVCLLSGGLDSTTALTQVVRKHGTFGVRTLSIHYGQKHSRELEAADEVAAYFGLPHDIIQLPKDLFLGAGSTLIDPDRETPSMTYADLDAAYGISPTYIPFRNATLLSVATAYCLTHGATQENPTELVFGAHADDEARDAYPDCSREFLGAMAAAVYVGSYRAVRLKVPFQYWEKGEITKLGGELQAPLWLTYSCYRGGKNHCGTCPTCLSRKRAFLQANVSDPTQYAPNTNTT